jgi:hypothetical protein
MTVTAQQPPARQRNLWRGNAMASRQAALKRDINAGRLFADNILLGTTGLRGAELEAAERLTAFKLLDAMPYYGVTRTRKLLTLARIPENKRIDELSDRQRRELCDRIRDRHDPRHTHRPRPRGVV